MKFHTAQIILPTTEQERKSKITSRIYQIILCEGWVTTNIQSQLSKSTEKTMQESWVEDHHIQKTKTVARSLNE